VALSRARHGLYVFGNTKVIRDYSRKQKQNDHLWIKVLNHLEERKMIVNEFRFQCRNHKVVTVIKNT